MIRWMSRSVFVAVLVLAPVEGRAQAGAPSAAPAPAPRWTEADVHFVSGMIPHHAQALQIAGWAATHGAGEAVRTLTARILVGQRDEIALMRGWLRERGEPVPDSTSTKMTMRMGGMVHEMTMPGIGRAHV